MRTQKTFISLFVIYMLAVSGASAANKAVPIDILATCDYDFYITQEEADEAKTYNANLGYTNSVGTAYFSTITVPVVFGQHLARSWEFSQQTYCWNFQVPGQVGLPDDGVITNATWTYQLITDLDNPPEGGFRKPTFALPVAKEDIKLGLATNSWSFSTTTLGTTKNLMFPEDQQTNCTQVNFIFVSASTFPWTVSAIYADASVSALGDIKANAPNVANSDYSGYAENEDLMMCNRAWLLVGGGTSQSSLISSSKTPVYVRHLKGGLDVDAKRKLAGLRFTAGIKNSQIVVMAVSVLPYQEPATLIVLK